MFRVSQMRGFIGAGLIAFAAAGSVPRLSAQQERHGRKYKAPPETAHIEVLVVKDFNNKPIQNAAVIFRPIEDGKQNGSLEIKTGPDGKASIDVIPRGSTVVVQVLANGYASFAQQYEIAEASKELTVRVQRPQAQVSAYEDNSGKESQRKAGVQEPVRPTAPKKDTPATGAKAAEPAKPAAAEEKKASDTTSPR